jgi:L-alanine-DL-glutamate epimerase-like enolase superfamily enzyme
MVGQMSEGRIATAAAAHAAIALGAPYRELYGADGITGDPARPALRYEGGRLHLPAGRGLGLEAYPITDDSIVLWDTTR